MGNAESWVGQDAGAFGKLASDLALRIKVGVIDDTTEDHGAGNGAARKKPGTRPDFDGRFNAKCNGSELHIVHANHVATVARPERTIRS